MKNTKVTKSKNLRILVLTTLLFALFIAVNTAASKELEIPCTITTYGDAWEGTLAFGLFQYDTEDIWQETHDYLVVMGTDGTVQYIRDNAPPSYNIVHWVEPDTLLFTGEPRTKVNMLNIATGDVTILTQKLGHHDVQYNPDTGNLMTLRKNVVTIGDMKYEHDTLVELDPTGAVVWSWTTADYFTPEMACEFSRVQGNSLDLTHCNSIDWDMINGVVYVNARNVNTFCKINATTGELIWSLGEYGDFTLLDKNMNPVNSLWYHSHSVEEVEPNVFLMFDNDLHNKTDVNHMRSRILEVTLDEDTMTAWISWSWTAPRDKFCGQWCDADRLPNGNRLGIFGAQQHEIENSTGAWLVEVSPGGEIVREYDFPYGWGMYRCEVVDTPSVITPTGFIDFPTRYIDDYVTMIYPNTLEEKPCGCSPASSTDWFAASILYAGLGAVTETFDTDSSIVNQTDGSLFLLSGASVITVGGPVVNPVTLYYESDETPSYNWAPIQCLMDGNWIEYRTREGVSVAGMPLDEVNLDMDYFLIEVFRDGRGRTIYICYGFGWKGTLAAGKYFDRELESLMSGENGWIVGQWTDSNGNGFVNGPMDGDSYTVIASG